MLCWPSLLFGFVFIYLTRFGLRAFGRFACANLPNADSVVRYLYTDDAALASGLTEVFGVGWTDAQKAFVLATLGLIDSSGDGRIGVAEVKTAVRDALGTAYGGIAGPLAIDQIAIAFDVLNNMPSVEVGSF